ncbi:MAG: glycosyltransferase family 1 protein [Pseudorhodoplanes sp.]|nr:glycosyltransferase family 1 protein [Pseudorhodoplanes sp.]
MTAQRLRPREMHMRRHWSINGRFLTQSLTGVQRYAHEILHALDALLNQGHPLTRDLEIELLVPPGTAVPPLHAIHHRSVGRVNGHLWEQTVLPYQTRGALISLCNTGPLSQRKHIVCIHDLNTRTCPHSYSPRFRAVYRILLPLLGRSATTIGTVSFHSASELIRYQICDREKIRLMPNGYEHTLRWTPRHSESTRAAAGRNTIVILGNPAPHKNIALIIGIANRLESAGLRIAVVGLGNSRVFNAGAFDPDADNIMWLGRLSDNELGALLLDSLCLAFPSFVEGFGLPPLEAMALGCPVVVSNRASLPEICGKAALYASPTNADDWFHHFVRLRADEHLRAALIKNGRERAPLFSWQKSAEKYLIAMARLDGIGAPADDAAPN